MAGRGGGEFETFATPPEGGGEFGAEVDIARLEAGRIGVGDVGGEDLLPLVAQRQGLSVVVERFFQAVGHDEPLVLHKVSVQPE